ncbi:MAG TPA: alpha/beta fold hydrolase [Solirubrobacterales bacterium]|nr:alpha/beta fold hydrolase [Solirubrobacterales bacterium]
MHATAIATSRRLIGIGVALLLAAIVAVPAEAADRKGPRGGGFYDPPKRLPNGHGKLIWKRAATKLTPIAGAKVNKTILYTSRSPQGEKVAVSGSVSVPPGKPPKGGWPVIAWAHGTTGGADSCAPTRIRPTGPNAGFVAYIHPQLEQWIAAGYAVVASDYQGLGTPGPHPYLVGKAEGRSVLDGVRAARRLVPDLGRKFLIAGHSQGGQSALFAAAMSDRWTPELKLRGTVAYAPASHIEEQAKLLPALTSPSPLSGLGALIFSGAATTSKDVSPRKILARDARALLPQIEQLCLLQLAEPDSFGAIAPADLFKRGADLSGLYDVLDDMNPALKIGPPILLAQGTADTTVFPSYSDMLVAELGERGGDVDYRTYPGVNHGLIVGAAEDDAMDFFQQRLPAR